MFIIVEDVDLIKVNSETVEYFSILKTDLDTLISYSSEGQQSYHATFANMKLYNRRLKERACEFHKNNFMNGSIVIDNKDDAQSTIPPLVERSFWNQNIFTKQFNKYISNADQKKSAILKKLLKKANIDSFLYKYKPVEKIVPDMS